jgi:hypothetical protein
MFDRLMGRAIAADADRVVGQNKHAAQLHQRRHADRAAAVVGEHQEGAAERDVAAVQRQAVHDGVHREFPRAVINQVTVRMFEIHWAASDPRNAGGFGEIRRAADQAGEMGP